MIHDGDPCDGPDGDADCAETCNETTRCCDAYDPNGSACNNQDACPGDICMDGACAPTSLECGEICCPVEADCCGGLCANDTSFPWYGMLLGCCNGAPYYKPLYGCCDGSIYTFGEDGCCDGVVYSLADEGCCENVAYSKTTHGCCDGVVQPLETCCSTNNDCKAPLGPFGRPEWGDPNRCCKEGNCEDPTPITTEAELNACEVRVSGNVEPEQNGCGSGRTTWMVPDNPLAILGCENASFDAACMLHDTSYQVCNITKDDADRWFHEAMIGVCDYRASQGWSEFCDKSCRELADTYLFFVQQLGRDSYVESQIQDCMCCD